MRLTTERLILRRPEIDDVGSLMQLLSDPSFAAVVPEIPRTEREIRAYLEVETAIPEPEADKCFNLLLERKIDRRVLGLTTLVLRRHGQGEIGYALHRDYRRHGYATEAVRTFANHVFAEFGVHRIYAETRVDNTASRKVMERIGMRREARFRETVREHDRRRDVVVYAVLADEWTGA